MWITLLFLCVTVIFRNNAQKYTNFEARTSTESPYAKSDINSDVMRSPVTLTIRNGRTNNINRQFTQGSDAPLFYSNQWQPILMPIDFSSNRNTDNYAIENGRSADHPLPTFLQRPNLGPNNTVPYHLLQMSGGNDFSSMPILYFQNNSKATSDSLTSDTGEIYPETLQNESVLPKVGNFQVFDLYRNPQNYIPPSVPFRGPSQSTFNSNFENHENDRQSKQYDPIPKSANSDLINSRTNVEIVKPLATEHYPTIPVPSTTMDFYRGQRYLPPVLPAYYPPYHFPPFNRDGNLQPMVLYRPNVPNFDREAGSEVHEHIQVVPEKHGVSDNASDHLIENFPSETPADAVPTQAIPLPVGGYPFGLYPPPFMPRFVPNIPPSAYSFPLPLPVPATGPRGNIADVLRQSPVLSTQSGDPGVVPVPDIVPEVLPHTDNFSAEEQTEGTSTTSEGNPEEVVAINESAAAKIPYAFGFDMNDGKGNDQHRNEVSDISGVVTGSYGYRGADGTYRVVNYVADKRGFRAFVQSNEPGVANSGSADVVVVAERPVPKAIAEGKKEAEPEIIAVPDIHSDVIASGSDLESQ